MKGLHLTADLRGVDPGRLLMTDTTALATACGDAVRAAGLSGVAELMHRFGPADGQSGITGVVLLAESHVAVHTWPELGAVTLDVYVCNLGGDNGGRAEALLRTLELAFAPARTEHHCVQRGTVLRTA